MKKETIISILKFVSQLVTAALVALGVSACSTIVVSQGKPFSGNSVEVTDTISVNH